MQAKINSYQSVAHPTVQSIINIKDWFDQIKLSQYSALISEARKFSKGELMYENIKKSIPCVTYNFTYSNYKNDDNIVSSTGLIYVDIDSPEFDINSLDLSKIYSYYRSFGGKGYSVLVKVEGVTKSNFKTTYLSICDHLGIYHNSDKNAIKHSQFNILSFDPEIYINDDAMIFNASSNELDNIQKRPKGSIIQKTETHISNGWAVFEKLRFDNTQKYITGSEKYVSNWKNRFDLVKAFIANKKLKDGSRYSFFLAYGTNVLALNPHLNFNQLLGLLQNVNPVACENPIDNKQLIKITNTLHKQLIENKLYSIQSPKGRCVIFSDSCGLTKEEKMTIVHQTQSDHHREEGEEKIYSIIESWDFGLLGKITQQLVAKESKMNIKTVKKYWSKFKRYVKDQNDNINSKNIKTTIKKMKQEVIETQTQQVVAFKQALKPLMKKEYMNAELAQVLAGSKENNTGIILKAVKVDKHDPKDLEIGSLKCEIARLNGILDMIENEFKMQIKIQQ